MRRAKALKSSYNHALVNVNIVRQPIVQIKNGLNVKNLRETQTVRVFDFPGQTVSKKRYPASDQDTHFM